MKRCEHGWALTDEEYETCLKWALLAGANLECDKLRAEPRAAAERACPWCNRMRCFSLVCKAELARRAVKP